MIYMARAQLPLQPTYLTLSKHNNKRKVQHLREISMHRPKEVDQAVIAIWISLGISVASAIISTWMNYVTDNYFVGVIMFYALYSLLPYHIGRRSNTARWIFLVLSALSLVLAIGLGFAELTPPDVIASIIVTPIVIFAIIRLLQERSVEWFEQDKSK